MKCSMLAVTMAILAATPVSAQERPAIVPSRDVTVDYRIDAKSSAAVPSKVHVEIQAGGNRIRVEPPDLPGYLLVDRSSGQIVMVMAQQRMFVDMPADAARIRMFTIGDSTKFTRKGSETIAGQRCTVWDVQDGGRSGTACLTADGVLLRGATVERGHSSGLTATAVKFGPLADSVFAPPPDFHKMDLPAGFMSSLGKLRIPAH